MAEKMNPVYYDWDQSNARARTYGTKHQVGFIAQELEQVLPEVVNKGEDTYRTVEYGQIAAIAIAAIKDLKALSDQRHGTCEASVDDLRRELASVRAENQALKEAVCEINPKAKVCH